MFLFILFFRFFLKLLFLKFLRVDGVSQFGHQVILIVNYTNPSTFMMDIFFQFIAVDEGVDYFGLYMGVILEKLHAGVEFAALGY